MTESRYVEKKGALSRLAHIREETARAAEGWQKAGYRSEAEWLRHVQEDFPKFIPFLTKNCGLEFRGRILEIGAGTAWFSAELSKLPKVVEVTTTDFSPRLLKEQAPKIFKLLKAHSRKITRTPADFYRLDFPNNHFDYVVCSALLHHGVNVTEVLREAKRVLKPGGQFVAIREPVKPLVKLGSRSRTRSKPATPGASEPCYSLDEYRHFFVRAGLELEVKRVNLSSGFKYYFDQMVNGLTHAHYAFVATKRGKSPRNHPAL